MRFYKSNNEICFTYVLACNRAEKNYKKIQKRFNFKDNEENKESNEIKELKELKEKLVPNGKICLVARSAYPGWECYMKEAEIEFGFLSC